MRRRVVTYADDLVIGIGSGHTECAGRHADPYAFAVQVVFMIWPPQFWVVDSD
jgi:hypothetical protein